MSYRHQDDDGRRDDQPEGFRPTGRQVGITIIVLVVVILAAVNFDEVKVDLIFGDIELPLFFVIVVSALLGMGIGALLRQRRERRKRDD
jgi:uncharacterized integral membrane protein